MVIRVDPMESVKCPACNANIVRPVGASTVCACTETIKATEAK